MSLPGQVQAAQAPAPAPAPVPAPNNQTTTVNIDRERILGKFRRALLIDDDLDYGQTVKESLHLIGIDATLVGSINAAVEQLSETSFPFILCDNIFEDRPSKKGSEFIRDEDYLFGDAQLILMTGFAPGHIVDLDILKGRGVHVVLKREPEHITRLMEFCQRRIEERAEQFIQKLESVCSNIVDKSTRISDLDAFLTDPYLLHRAQEYFINYLMELPNQQLEQFFINGQVFKPSDLVDEIKRGSKVGRDLIDALLDDMLEAYDE